MSSLLSLGRVLLGLGFALDGGWWLSTWDVRAAYLDRAGIPSFVIVPFAATYLIGGVLVAAGRSTREATLPLMAVAGLIATLLHTELGPGGIGEYPLDAHARVNAQALLIQIGLVGALMVTFAAPDVFSRVDLRAVVLGRVLLGAFFVCNALWQAAYYEALEASGADPSATNLFIVIQVVFGMMLAAGSKVRTCVAALALVSIASMFALHSDFSETAIRPPGAQIHGWFVRTILLAGLIQLAALGAAASARFSVPREDASLPGKMD